MVGGTQAPPKIELEMRHNSTHILFFSRNVALNGFQERVVQVLTAAKLDPSYYKLIASGEPNGPGVLIYIPGMLASGISRSGTVAEVGRALGVPILNQSVQEGAFANQNFTPPIKIKKLTLIPESVTSILVGPIYPLESFFPKAILSPTLLSVEVAAPNILRFKGTQARIMAAIYAIKIIAKYEAPGVFETFVLNDVQSIFSSD